MNKWIIDKSFSFCYGHRVWTQELKKDYCAKNDTQCKCRHLHGHEGLVHVFLESNSLENGMVTDFKHLGWLKDFLDTYIDHKFIIDVNDPIYDHMVNTILDYCVEDPTKECFKKILVPGTENFVGMRINVEELSSIPDVEKEILEGYLIVDFVPTSENLSKWLYDIVNSKMSQIGVKVSRIDWFETPKSRSSYIG